MLWLEQDTIAILESEGRVGQGSSATRGEMTRGSNFTLYLKRIKIKIKVRAPDMKQYHIESNNYSKNKISRLIKDAIINNAEALPPLCNG